MKKAIILSIFLLSCAVIANAAETVRVRQGQTVVLDHGLLRIKFVSVVEDSRCPEGVQCIQAGHAKVKLLIRKGRSRSHTLIISTDEKPKEAGFYGYSFNLDDVLPHKMNPRMKRMSELPTALLTVNVYR